VLINNSSYLVDYFRPEREHACFLKQKEFKKVLISIKRSSAYAGIEDVKDLFKKASVLIAEYEKLKEEVENGSN
jgi:hypothetical protein